MKPSHVRSTLKNLPKTLDDTYARILSEIDDLYREDARRGLQWLAFSARPIELAELAEAIGIDPTCTPPFDPDDRFPDPESVLQIFSSLVTTSGGDNARKRRVPGPYIPVFVRLAHFSVKEYLLSERIGGSTRPQFGTSTLAGNKFLAECSLLYIFHYAGSSTKTPTEAD